MEKPLNITQMEKLFGQKAKWSMVFLMVIGNGSGLTALKNVQDILT